MKNKSFSSHRERLRRRNFDNMFQLARPQSEKVRLELENILRWEDDGGLIIESAASKLEKTFLYKPANQYK